MARATESEIAFAVLAYLDTLPSGTATIKSIKHNLPSYITLSHEDQEMSITRIHEQVWEQQVRNIVSHRLDDGNYIHEGYLTRSPGKLSITPLGRSHLLSGHP